MSSWGGGYITDITYMPGWYRMLSPAMMAIAALLGNVAAHLPGPDDKVSYLELGCGQGYGANLLAASNPNWDITAIDFNPAHIAGAREWAADAGLTNIRFIEADLSTLAEDALSREIPEADYVSLHGLWTWVPPVVQAGVVRLLAAKVKAGGLVHISYNALPGWGPAMGMQRLLRETGLRFSGRSDAQIQQAVGVAKELRDAKAMQFQRSSVVLELMENLDSLPREYLAHEYMNASWAPRYHSEVAEALSGAKLEWVASSGLPENFPELMFTAEQQAVLKRFDDPMVKELIKDICLNRLLRHDVFVRGPRRLNAAQRNEKLMGVGLSLSIKPEDMPYDAELPIGKVELSRPFYEPILAELAKGPRFVSDLLALPDVVGRRDNPAELIGILVGLDLAEPAVRPAAGPGEAAMRFNRRAAAHYGELSSLSKGIGVASHVIGGGMTTSVLDMMVMDRALAGETTIDALLGYISGPDSKQDQLRAALQTSIEERLPILRAAGVW